MAAYLVLYMAVSSLIACETMPSISISIRALVRLVERKGLRVRDESARVRALRVP